MDHQWPLAPFLSRALRYLLVVSVFVYPATGHATTVLEQTFSDLVHRADVIAVGTVTDIREEWDERQQAPFTAVTFSDLSILKGQPPSGGMTLSFLGGHTPDGLLLTIPGVPRFTVGEKNVVFCAGNQRDFCPLVGLWQGRLRVTFDAQRGVETISDNFRVPILGIRHDRFVKRRPDTPPQAALTLPALIQAIRQELHSANDQS